MQSFPRIDPVGLDGIVIRFADHLNESANRAALALRAYLEAESWEGIEESATSLVSTYLRFDPLHLALETLCARVQSVLAERDWYDAPLPEGRRFLRIPTLFGSELAPQLNEAAEAAGMSEEEAIHDLGTARLRVSTIGFAPAQPYLGILPPAWDIPRQSALTDQVAAGALVVAIRQLVLFSNATPTGWRHVGQSHARLFRPDSETPFMLRPGDEVQFPAISRETFEHLRAAGTDGIEAAAL